MKKKINLVWLSYKSETPARGYWDQELLEDLLQHNLWTTVNGYSFKESTLQKVSNGCIIVFPARAQTDCLERLNNDIAKLKWCLIIFTGDEETRFPYRGVCHDNLKMWVMAGRPDRCPETSRIIGSGYPIAAKKMLLSYRQEMQDRALNWFFAGQVNHDRRIKCVEKLREIGSKITGKLVETKGFTLGLPQEEYYKHMASCKVVPCSSGPYTPDTFRLYEALEAGCVPIADKMPSSIVDNFQEDYFKCIFGEDPPFPIIKKYNDLEGHMVDILQGWKKKANQVFSWWQQYKRALCYALHEDIRELLLKC